MNYIEIILVIVAIISFVFSAISILQLRSSRKKLALYSHLLFLNENDAKEQDFNQTIRKFEKEMLEEVPKQAKRIVLFDKLKDEEKKLCICYDNFCKTKNEYESIVQEQRCDVPDELLDDIESYILPDYIANKKREKCMLFLTIISYLSAFLSLIPVIKDISQFCLLLTIYPLIKLAILNAPKKKKARKRYFLDLIYKFSLLVLFLADIYFSVYVHYHWWTDYNTELALALSLIGTLLLLIPKVVKFFRFIKNSTFP